MNCRPRNRVTAFRDGIGTKETLPCSSMQYRSACLSAPKINRSALSIPVSFADKITLPAMGEYGIAE